MALSSNVMLDKVKTLFQTDLNNILKKELHNENRVNLYSVGEYWAAFEKSAYLLGQMLHDDTPPIVLYINEYPFPIVMQSLHYRTVDDMCRKHIMSRKSLEYLQFATHPTDEVAYKEWYRENVLDD
mgnify:CR=1 FL=1